MNTLFYILASTIIVSLISLVGIFSLSFKDAVLKKILLVLVGLSAGALLGGAFFDLIPEAMKLSSSAPVFIVAGIVLFFMLERYLYWHHCHEGKKCDVHMFTYLSLVGDSVHNFIDGVIIAVSFLVSIPLGIVTSIAIIAHEIPQELGDFAILVYGGFKKSKALLFNFLTALTCILGALLAYLAASVAKDLISVLIPFAAGGFIYIAASDLIPELHREKDLKKASLSFLFFIIGLALMFAISFLE